MGPTPSARLARLEREVASLRRSMASEEGPDQHIRQLLQESAAALDLARRARQRAAAARTRWDQLAPRAIDEPDPAAPPGA